MNIIETKNLCFAYQDGGQVLDRVSISIQKGKFTGILGGNGAGKSTLFLNLNGVLIPQGGDVLFDGKKVVYDKKSIADMRKRVGIVFQDPNDQLFSASVRKDISFGAVNLGLGEEEICSRVDEAVLQTGIEELVDRPTHALSFGQKKRVSIAGILVMRPDVIILDEPTAGLDPAGVSDILKLLVNIKEESNISIVIATHDMDIVPLYCDYAYVMDHGKVAAQGTAEELFADAKALRQHDLRLPRIAHLMQIMKHKDGIAVDESAGTISAARRSIKEILKAR